MIAYDLLLLIFALLGVMLTYKENEFAVIAGVAIVAICFTAYLVMFILHCVWHRKDKTN